MKIKFSALYDLRIALVLLSFVLASCSGPASLSATPAPTQVVPTLAASPTNTPFSPATQVPPPTTTATSLPTVTQAPSPTATSTSLPTATLVPSETPVPATPTRVNTQPPPLSAQVLKVWTYSNQTVFIANQGFSLAIYLKNTGNITWQPGYQLKFTGLTNGGDITVQPQQDLTVAVAPGGKIEFDLWAFGSETLGDHTWFFELFTDTGKAVPGSGCSFTFTMIHN